MQGRSMVKKIRVMIVDDSPVARSFLKEGLSKQPNIEIAGEAINAFDAKQKIERFHPDVMTLDVEMPGMNGIDFVKSILPKYRIPIILVSSLNLRVFDALAVGAVDFVRKPDGSPNGGNEQFIRTLANKVLIASHAKVHIPGEKKRAAAPVSPQLVHIKALTKPVVIALGASTGGTEATLDVLRRLPANTPGIVIVQHMPPGFTQMYADRLDKICSMRVKEAKTGDPVEVGTVLIAPGDKQMEVVRSGMNYAVRCFPGAKVSGHCPSVDVLFRSMAANVKCHMLGIIMTGMGRDGADGLLAMRKSGAYTIGQDQESCVVYGMPKVAYDIGGVVQQSPLDQIAGAISQHLNTWK